jgi:hypothetical protein
MARTDFGEKLNITDASTTVVRTGPGALMAIIVNAAVANGTITIYDNTAGSGTKIGTITYPATLLANHNVFPYFCKVTTGLTIVTTGTADITVVYK